VVIAVGGEALIDLVIDPRGVVSTRIGGAPLNVARTAARLGQVTRFLSALSTDRLGSLIRRRLVDDGVDLSWATTTDLPTTLAAAEIDQRGTASFRFYAHGTSAPSFTPDPRHEHALADARALYVGALALVLEPMASTFAALVANAPVELLVVVDPNCRAEAIDDRPLYLQRLREVLGRADVVKVSVDDLAYLAPGRRAQDAARDIQRLGPAVVLVTAGSRDTLVLMPGGELAVPVSKVEVTDTIGAGDAFIGAFVTWWTTNGLGRDDLWRREAVGDAATAAIVVAARTCERRGAEPPGREQLPADWSAPRHAAC
jgi:fructokinase